MKKVLSILLLGAMLLATLASCGGDGSDSTSAGTTTKAPAATTTPGGIVNTTPPEETGDDEDEPVPETPMTLADVENWVSSHTALDDKIDPNGFFCSGVGLFADGGLPNLFDKIYTKADWDAAMVPDADGKTEFDKATFTDKVDMNGSGVLGDEIDSNNDGVMETDQWIALGKFGFMGTSGTFYWSMTEPVTLGSYVIYTGNDNSQYPNRNPVGWQIYATNDDNLGKVPDDINTMGVSTTVLNDKDSLLEAGWVCLDDVYDGSMEDADFTPFGYEIDKDKQGEYKYYCWRIDYGGDDTSLIQCTGMKLFAAE